MLLIEMLAGGHQFGNDQNLYYMPLPSDRAVQQTLQLGLQDNESIVQHRLTVTTTIVGGEARGE